MSSKYDDDYDEDSEGKASHVSDHKQRSVESKDDNERMSAQESMTDDEMVEKVQEFFFADDTLSKTFESFVKERAGMIDLESSEFKLEYTVVYEEFKSIFEAEIESFIENKLGCSIQRFYNALKNKTDENENSTEAIFAKILLAVCDFDVFMTMMREEAVATSRK